jgi:hypothetical protein
VQWDEGAELERKQQQQQQVVVAAAWRLVMQHRCWYEYAVWLLVHSSLRVLLAPPAHKSPGASPPQQLQQQQQQQQQQAPATQQPSGTRQQLGAASGSGRDDALRDAALAAEFVAWMVAPSCAERWAFCLLWGRLHQGVQGSLQEASRPPPVVAAVLTVVFPSPPRQGTCAEQLLGCIDAAASAAAADTSDTAATTPAPGTSALPAAAAADALLAAWSASRGGANSGSGACWPWWLGSVDLPAALLQHPSVLLSGLGPALLAAAAAERQGATAAAGIDAGSAGALRGSGVQLLEQTVLGGARDALEAVSAAVLELLQPAAAKAPAGGSGSGGASAGAAPAPSLRPNPQQPQQPQLLNAGGPTQAAQAARARTRRSWLAGCVRHVLTAGGLPLGEGSSQPQPAAAGSGAGRVLASRLRQLLAAAQACQDACAVTAT